jgi:acetolactate synthase I/II/III large subunit
VNISPSNFAEDLVAAFAGRGIKDAFIVTGGAVGPVTSALANSTSITCHYMLNEQSAAIAAESYGYVDGKPALLVVTSGPGVTNALTGVAAAFTNSSPVIVISGQARAQDVNKALASENRQIGNQHLSTRGLVEPIVKGFIEPLSAVPVGPLVDSMLELATSNRPGPVWLSVPQDIQRAFADSTLPSQVLNFDEVIPEISEGEIHSISELVASAKRPILLIGNGARAGIEGILRFARSLSAPVMTTWPGLDLLEDNDPLYVGRPGSIPSGWLPNILLDECDLLVVIGARMDLAQVGYNPSEFAKQAKIIRIDIDLEENFRIEDHPNQETWNRNSAGFNSYSDPIGKKYSRGSWIDRIQSLRKLPAAGEISQNIEDGMSTYSVVGKLSERLRGYKIATGSSGTCIEMLLQSWRVSEGQRLINSCGLGSMGFGVAATLGVVAKSKNQNVACIESDGSLLMNLQDLVSASNHKNGFPIFVLNSHGYKSISLSQRRQGLAEHGSSPASGLDLLGLKDGEELLGIPVKVVTKEKDISSAIDWAITGSKTKLVSFHVSITEEALPRLMTLVDPATGKLVTPKMSQLHPPL